MIYIVSWSLNLLALQHDVIIRERLRKTNRDCQQTSDSKQGEWLREHFDFESFCSDWFCYVQHLSLELEWAYESPMSKSLQRHGSSRPQHRGISKTKTQTRHMQKGSTCRWGRWGPSVNHLQDWLAWALAMKTNKTMLLSAACSSRHLDYRALASSFCQPHMF